MNTFTIITLITIIAASTSGAAETNNNHDNIKSCTGDGSNDDKQQCLSTIANDDDATKAIPRSSPIRRNQNIQLLPTEYIEQLEEVDELLRIEEENMDPIITCNEYLNMDGFVDPVDLTKSLYQEISWAENTDKPDKCLTLDDTLQICNSYRPHYHEYFVHFPASFLPQMRRVIFVGGGDSMLLHELLHYPDLELVVGLELDQVVVRDSFRHLFTQPHFDNPKVQWWFGDAAKSLRMLPKDWYGTFDLVMVDLSETVMSMTVSEELDILKALSLLVNPDHGIFVKNERYLWELSEIFDHVIQIYLPDTPLLCDQDWVFGSHGIDFLHPDFDRLLKQYRIPTFLYQPIEDQRKHYELIKDYAKNDPQKLSICNIDAADFGKQPRELDSGIMMILEAENASYLSNPAFKLSDSIVNGMKNVGKLRIISSDMHRTKGGGQVAIIHFHEGYITATTWPSLYYCAFDIVLWGQFHHLESTRDILLNAVGALRPGDWSSYRIIVGGMYGTDTREDDLDRTGPKMTVYKNCNKSADATIRKQDSNELNSLPPMDVILKESVSLLSATSVSVVFCGGRDKEECDSLNALKSDGNLSKTIALWTCNENVSDENNGPFTFASKQGVVNLVLCETTVKGVLQEIISKFGKLSLVVVDSAAPPISVIDGANAVCNVPVYADDSMLNKNALVVVPYLDRIGAYFLEICRTKLDERMLRVAEVSMHMSSSNDEKIGYLSMGNPLFLGQLVEVMKHVEEHTSISTNLVSMQSIPVEEQDSYTPHQFTMYDFDEYPGMMQYARQKPLGKQSLLQMKFENTTITQELLKKRAIDFLNIMNISMPEPSIINVGDGVILNAFFKEGHVIIAWNGRSSVDVNMFSYDERLPHKEAFEEFFMKPINLTSTLTLWDEHPRGTENVINFLKDINGSPSCINRYVLCDTYAAEGDCEDEEEKDWMAYNCQVSCGCPGTRINEVLQPITASD